MNREWKHEETFTVRGLKHQECGNGPAEKAEDGIRWFCPHCGVMETWEQAARTLDAWVRQYSERHEKLRKVEGAMRRFVREMGLGYLLK